MKVELHFLKRYQAIPVSKPPGQSYHDDIISLKFYDSKITISFSNYLDTIYPAEKNKNLIPLNLALRFIKTYPATKP